jgi:hypothetical protein
MFVTEAFLDAFVRIFFAKKIFFLQKIFFFFYFSQKFCFFFKFSYKNFLKKNFFRFFRKVKYPTVLWKKFSPPIYNAGYVLAEKVKFFIVLKNFNPPWYKSPLDTLANFYTSALGAIYARVPKKLYCST